MRFVKVSDFLPAGEPKVEVVVLERMKKNGKTEVPQRIECVLSGEFVGEISLYPDYAFNFLDCSRFSFLKSEEELLKALEERGRELFKKERELFPEAYKGLNLPSGGIPVKLGFGGGALSKTFLEDSLRWIRRVPTTLPVVKNRPVGWCLLEVEDCH